MDTLHIGTRRVPENPGEKGESVDFPKQNLVRNVQILGQAGSGKTVMAKVILEECALAGIPSIILDVQGDLARLAMPPEDGPKTDSERQKMWSENVEPRVWTPLSESGLQICINPFDLPGDTHDTPVDGETGVESWRMMATGLGSLLGADESSNKGRQNVSFLENHMKSLAESNEAPYDFGELAESMRNLSKEEHQDQITSAALGELARTSESYNTPSESALFTKGSPLDIGMMLQEREPGRTPVNILYLNTLRTKERQQMFIQQFCRQMWQWLLDNPSTELQCILFLDEARSFLPAVKSPPSKEAIKLMLNEGRKYGLGTIIATQSPADVDYKATENTETAFVGQLRKKQSIEHMKNLIETDSDSDAIIANLPSLKSGEFELFSPSSFPGEVVRMHSRWLLTPHGQPLLPKELRALVSNPLREWAKGFTRSTPKRKRLPSWKIREPTAPMELMHGIPTLRSAEDPMEVMLTTTNALTMGSLLLTTFFLGQRYIEGELGIAWLAIGGAISVFLSVLLAIGILLRDESEKSAQIRHRTRGFEWIVLSWMLVLGGIDWLGWIDLGWVYYPVMASQMLLIVFVALEYLHSLRLASTSIDGDSLLERLKSVGAALNEAERTRAISSSDDLVRRFGLVTTTLTVLLLTSLLWSGSDLSEGYYREAAVRLVTLEGSFLISTVVSSIWRD